jgi:hypothetical protein
MNSIKIFISLCLFAVVSTSNAGLITCGSSQRTASFDAATACVTGLNNPKVSTINTNFSSTTGWVNAGELTSDGDNQYLSASLTSGSWGSSPVEGSWLIDPDFWMTYNQAAISIHVGNGGGDPDYFSWLVEDQATSGLWAYTLHEGKGGGLSNIKLWGADTASILTSTSTSTSTSNSVSEPAILAMFALGVFGLSVSMRSSKKPH